MEFDFTFILLAFLAVAAITTFLVKHFFKADTWFLISLIKTKKPLPFFEKMAKHEKFIDIFAAVGLILGFGAVAVDYLFWGKLSRGKRIALFIASTTALSFLVVLLDYFFGSIFSNNILIGGFYPVLVLSFGVMGLSGFALFSLALQALDIVSKYLIGVRGCPGVAPLIPGVELPNVPITPPLHAWISLLIILVVHEAMHGIVGKRHGFRLKSAGVLLLGFLPIGAFVEPDEKQVKKAKGEKLLPFLAAGPMANIALMVIAGLVVFGALAVIPPLTNSVFPGVQESIFSGVKVSSVLEDTSFCGSSYGSPAHGVLMEGDSIKAVNGAEVKNISRLFNELQKNRFAEKTFSLERGGEGLEVSMTPNALGQFGFVPGQIRNESFTIPQDYITYALSAGLLVEFFYWLFLLSFLVAVINFLPMHPFDGGRIARVLFAPHLSFLGKSEAERQKIVEKFFLAFVLALFIINALPLFF
ncbi:MAG TPA: site-2 protease family protein [archaeon]|nr:site-2 protease family protein [archaeon]